MIFRRVIGTEVRHFPATVAFPTAYSARVEVLECGHDGRVERFLRDCPLPPVATKRHCRVCGERQARKDRIGLRVVK